MFHANVAKERIAEENREGRHVIVPPQECDSREIATPAVRQSLRLTAPAGDEDSGAGERAASKVPPRLQLLALCL